MMKIGNLGIIFSTLTAVSFADCNGVYIDGYAFHPFDVCTVLANISLKNMCHDDDTGYVIKWGNDDCSGDAMGNETLDEMYGGNVTAKCSESSDCSYLTFSGHIGNESSTFSCDSSGTYYEIPLITDCSESLYDDGTSNQISCSDNGSVIFSHYNTTTDCSGDANSFSNPCLFCDGVMAMTVKVVFAAVMLSWIAMA